MGMQRRRVRRCSLLTPTLHDSSCQRIQLNQLTRCEVRLFSGPNANWLLYSPFEAKNGASSRSWRVCNVSAHIRGYVTK